MAFFFCHFILEFPDYKRGGKHFFSYVCWPFVFCYILFSHLSIKMFIIVGKNSLNI